MSESLQESAPSERRAFVRHRRRLDVLWQMLGLSSRDMIAGRVFDLSITGVGLTVDQPFAADAVLMLRLPTKQRGWSSHLIRVRQCNADKLGKWKLGCVFLKPLNEDQLHGHLE